jgi:carbonic anhydrase
MHDALQLSRREFMHLAGAVAGVGAASACRAAANEPADGKSGADDVLRRLLEGNARFVRGQLKNPRRRPDDFRELAEGQNPVAAIVGCADSRVPPELLFDQGVGDLFVVRVAGNVVGGAGATVKGSIEYAVAELNVPLVLVLGHSNCGAVKAAVKHLDAHDALPGAINELVNLIKPAVANGEGRDRLEQAIKANVVLGVGRLKTLEPILAGPVKQGRVKVVGGVYDLRSGKVEMVA